MNRDLDALTSSTLKHLREHWWDDAFTAFLEETLRPRAGKRILDVGCGTGTAEISLARLRLSQVDLFGVDLVVDRVRDAHAATRGINARVSYAAADACRLPFAADSFDSTYCVAVLQHIRDCRARSASSRGSRGPAAACSSSSRTTPRATGSARCRAAWRRSSWAGASSPGSSPCAASRRRQPSARSCPACSPPPASSRCRFSSFRCRWRTRRRPPPRLGRAPRRSSRAAHRQGARRSRCAGSGADYLKAIDQYARDASTAGPAFVEIQNTMLFATVGQRRASDAALVQRRRSDGLGRRTRRSTTGRTRRPSRAATSPSGSGWRWRNDGPVLELGCGTGRIVAAGRQGRRAAGRDRPVRADAGARAAAPAPRAARPIARCSSAATSARCRSVADRLRPGDGAVRHPAVADARARSRRPRCASVARVLGRGGLFALDLVPDLPRWPSTTAAPACGPRGREDDPHARRVGPPGSPAQAHDLRSGIHRAAGPRADGPPFRADVPHALGAADGPAAREGRLRDRGGARRLPGRAVGRAGRRLGHPGGRSRRTVERSEVNCGVQVRLVLGRSRSCANLARVSGFASDSSGRLGRKLPMIQSVTRPGMGGLCLPIRGRIMRLFPRCFRSFCPCPAIPSGTRSSTRRAPPTPSAARCSRASSRN